MRKKLLRFLCILICFFPLLTYTLGNASMEHGNYHTAIDETDIVEIEIICDVAGQGYPKPPEKSYVYQISEKNIIQNIVYYINSFDLREDGKTTSGGDLPIVNIDMKFSDGTIKKVGFIDGRFYDEKGKQFDTDKTEYKRFLDHIYALKSGKIVLSDEITFEPSEWAKEHIKKAIENGLVPKWNQISYVDNITRLEVCQLIENLIKNSGHTVDGTEVNPFLDTSDTSVVLLYHLKILNGKSETMFCPYDFITREEFAKILSNTYHCIKGKTILNSSKSLYKDQDKISDWAIDSVNDMTSLGLLKGNEKNEFEPQNRITKEEVILTILRF